MNRLYRPLDLVRRFIVGGSFPAFALSLLAFYELLVVVMLLIPPGNTGTAAFAEEFRVWCFGYDPATGRTEWSYVMAMTIPQLMLGGMIVALWWEPLSALLARPRAAAGHAAVAAALVVTGAVGIFGMADNEARIGELPFPAEALRTATPPPGFSLVNQQNDPVSLPSLRGNVVLMTAMYASCPHTCPAILAESKRAVGSLTPAERADLRIVAVTLDPTHDSTEALAELAGMHGMDAPLYNLLTGPPAEVEQVLDDMGIARTRDPETGIIDHANLFLLIDRNGRVAYRFGLGERQSRWLASALQVLLHEPLETS